MSFLIIDFEKQMATMRWRFAGRARTGRDRTTTTRADGHVGDGEELGATHGRCRVEQGGQEAS